ncbi:MAG: class II aldolase/adducin family protein [Planctomycetota bacterium]|nr:class II aldolase/adducin family protein [Planctomycetota bacterium]
MSDISWNERELRRLMVKACQALERRGLVAATDGNVTARLSPDRVLVTPSGCSKGEVTELSILVCDLEGRKVRGKPGQKISSEVHLHLAAYRERPEIGGVVHAHPPVASAFSFSGREALLREPVIPEVVAQIGPVLTAPYVTPGTRALAEAAAPLLKECDAVLLAQHGAVTLGPDPWRAYLRMEKLEHAAGILKASVELAGSESAVKRLTRAQVSELIRSYGDPKLLKRYALGEEGGDESIVERIAEEVLKRLRAG